MNELTTNILAWIVLGVFGLSIIILIVNYIFDSSSWKGRVRIIFVILLSFAGIIGLMSLLTWAMVTVS